MSLHFLDFGSLTMFLVDAADLLFLIFKSWLVFEIVVTSVLID